MAKENPDFILCEPYDRNNIESVLCNRCGYVQFKPEFVKWMKAGKPICPKCDKDKMPPAPPVKK